MGLHAIVRYSARGVAPYVALVHERDAQPAHQRKAEAKCGVCRRA